MVKKIFIAGILFSIFSYSASVFSQEVQNKDVVIINNEAAAKAQILPVTAPALVPSEAKKLREAREQQEIKTEDTIIKELEKQRLLEEQKRIDKLFGNSSKEAPAQKVAQPASRQWLPFVNKSFVSAGAGFVTYPDTDVNSTNFLALFGSFGGYGYEGHLMFDLSLYYSQHYVRAIINYSNIDFSNIREKLHQPAASVAVKYSPLSGKMKPYVGLSGSLIGRRWFYVYRTGQPLEAAHPIKDVAEKTWHLSVDGGLTVGADLALGERLGLNVDVRYHWNLYTENRDIVPPEYLNVTILDKRDSVIFSGNVRYYF